MKSIVLMFIAATCQSMEQPSYDALAADMTTTEERGKAYSLQYLCANLGLVMSPTIAGFLFKDYLWAAFLISGIAIGLSSVLIFILVKDISKVKEEDEKAMYQAERGGESLWTILRENKIVIIYILAFSGYYATYQMYNYLMPLDLTGMHGDNAAVIFGSVASVNCAVVVIFTPIITRLFPKMSEPVKTIFAQALLLAGFAVFLLFAGQIPFYYAAMVILTWGEIFGVLAESPYLTKRIPASHRGRIDGLTIVVRAGVVSGYQMLIGFIYGTCGRKAAWITVLVTGSFFILLMLVLAVQDRRVYRNLYEK